MHSATQRYKVNNCFAAAAAVFLLVSGVKARTAEWKTFVSPGNFSIQYPTNWFNPAPGEDRLNLLSEKRHAEGVIIDRGEANIVVNQAPSGYTLAKVANLYLNDTPEEAKLPKRQKDLPAGALSEECDHSKELVATTLAVPTEDLPKGVHIPNQTFTAYLCQHGKIVIAVTVLNWANDKRQAEYQETARKMAQSLRFPG